MSVKTYKVDRKMHYGFLMRFWQPLVDVLTLSVRPINILIGSLVLVSLLASCSNHNHKAQITDLDQPEAEKVKFHIVAKGETLYSIAWRYNLNFKALAQLNGVDSTYHIFPGQRLSLDMSAKSPEKTRTQGFSSAKTLSQAKKPITTETPRSKKTSLPVHKKTTTKKISAPSKWHWPARGKLVATFSSNGGLNKGIDIKGKLGEPVYTAAAGSVVYSGSGLRGYGKLVIVKHSEKYLSAYAHNRRLLVREGDKVKAGEKIAEMGSSGSDTVKLHFEIRYDGKPIDPLKLLPRK